MDYAADIDQLAPGFDDEGSEFPGDDVWFPDGYGQLIEHVARDTDPRTGEAVRRISHGDSGTTVSHTTGSTSADAVIVTVPLGVLKEGSIQFDPALGNEKLGAIQRLGMGHLSKVYLRFPEVFWDPDVELFGFAGEERGAFPLWVNMAAYTGEPILMAFQSGSRADETSGWSDERIVAAAVAALRQTTGAA